MFVYNICDNLHICLWMQIFFKTTTLELFATFERQNNSFKINCNTNVTQILGWENDHKYLERDITDCNQYTTNSCFVT